MNPFQAVVVKERDGDITFALEEITLDQLSPGEVIIKVSYSSVNFKDSLAVKRHGGVIRDYPMIPGIDLSGTVVSSTDPAFTEGQEVLATGFQIGMSHTGGYSEYARLPAGFVVPLPEGLSLRDAMIIGTAGFTAALSITALEKAGMNPESDPEILVTGASGGVGSTAIQLLTKKGYKNINALYRRPDEENVLLGLGASTLVPLNELVTGSGRPLEKQRFHFVLDTVGGDVAAAALGQIHYGGSISMCGNAGGVKLSTNVLPFILRGVNILGIDSVNVPLSERPAIWARFAKEWNIMGDSIVNVIGLDGLGEVFEALQQGTHQGRSIVRIG